MVKKQNMLHVVYLKNIFSGHHCKNLHSVPFNKNVYLFCKKCFHENKIPLVKIKYLPKNAFFSKYLSKGVRNFV